MNQPENFAEKLNGIYSYFLWVKDCVENTNVFDELYKDIFQKNMTDMSTQIIDLGVAIGYDKDKPTKKPQLFLFSTDDRLEEAENKLANFNGIHTVQATSKKVFTLLSNYWKSLGFNFIDKFEVEAGYFGVKVTFSLQFKDTFGSFSSDGKETLKEINEEIRKKMSSSYETLDIDNRWFLKDTDNNRSKLLSELGDTFGKDSLQGLDISTHKGNIYLDKIKFFIKYENIKAMEEEFLTDPPKFVEVEKKDVADKKRELLDKISDVSSLFFLFQNLYDHADDNEQKFNLEESSELYMHSLETAHIKIVELLGVKTEVESYVDSRYQKERAKNLRIREIESELKEKGSIDELRDNLKLIESKILEWWEMEHFHYISNVSVSKFGDLSATLSLGIDNMFETHEDISEKAEKLKNNGFDIVDINKTPKLLFSQKSLDRLSDILEIRFPHVRIISTSTSMNGNRQSILETVTIVLSGTQGI